MMGNSTRRTLGKKSHLQGDRGSIAVEFALMFPLFLLLLFATYELGIYLHDKQVVTHAVREAARFGIILQNPRPLANDIRNIVANRIDKLLIGSALNCVPNTCSDVDVAINGVIDDVGISGDLLTVTVNTTYPFPILSSFSNFGDVPFFAQSAMVLE